MAEYGVVCGGWGGSGGTAFRLEVGIADRLGEPQEGREPPTMGAGEAVVEHTLKVARGEAHGPTEAGGMFVCDLVGPAGGEVAGCVEDAGEVVAIGWGQFGP